MLIIGVSLSEPHIDDKNVCNLNYYCTSITRMVLYMYIVHISAHE